MNASTPVFVGLGSNLGESVVLLREALQRLSEHSIAPLCVSSLWSSTPVDCPPGSPSFVNAVARLTLDLQTVPEALLDTLQELEKAFGRRPKLVLNEARPLDLDLLAWGDRVHSSPRLILPHPRAHLRRFVLEPWAEIDPDWVIPGQRDSVRSLLAALQTDEVLHRLG